MPKNLKFHPAAVIKKPANSKAGLYQLVRPYDDGSQVHLKGAIIKFPSNKAPSSALFMSEEQLADRAKAHASSTEGEREALRNELKREILAELRAERLADAGKAALGEARSNAGAQEGSEIPELNVGNAAVETKPKGEEPANTPAEPKTTQKAVVK